MPISAASFPDNVLLSRLFCITVKMSGLEPLVALGLACNVMQTIDFGHKTVSLCKRIYQTGAPEPSLAENGAHLKTLSGDMSAQLSAKPKPLNKRDQELLSIATKCSAATKDLCEEITFLSVPANRTGFPRRCDCRGQDYLEETST